MTVLQAKFLKSTDIVWGLLLALTCMSFYLSEQGADPRWVPAWVLGIATLKVCLIGYDFMELKHVSKILLGVFVFGFGILFAVLTLLLH